MKLGSLTAIIFLFVSAGLFAQELSPPTDVPAVSESDLKETAPPPQTQPTLIPPTATSITLDKYGAPKTVTKPAEGGAVTPPVATATDQPAPLGDEPIYLNATDVDIRDMIKQISKATGTNFLIDDKTRGKITIISEKPMTKEMAYQAFLSALDVMGYTTVATPGGLVKIVSTKEAIQEPLDLYKDETPNTDRFITRIVQVVNISANDISSVVKTLVSKEGNLFAYPATNSLIITDAGSNIDRILKIIKELDQEGPQEVIEIIPIQNADAKDVAQKVVELFSEDAEAAKKGGVKRGGKGGGELEEVPSISKVITDDRTNSVIVLGTKRSIIKIRSLIAQLDSPLTGVEGTIHVHYLKHANAKEVAEVLSSLVSDAGGGGGKGEDKKGEPKKAGAVQLEAGVKVTADEGTNALVITASPKDFETLIAMVVNKLDIPRRQVYLEAVIMELTVDKARTLGLSGNFANAFGIGSERLGAFGAMLPITPSVIQAVSGAGGGLAGGMISERNFDFTLADGSTISIPAVSAILQALETNTDVNILSTPSILTLDNEEAQIQIGQEVPTPSGTTVSSGVTTFNVTREDTGIILKITPQISESDTVRLKMTQEITNVVGTDPTLGPTLTKRAVQTVVVAHDKQTIVIGGLIDDRATVTTNKIPFLGDIPILGNLFRNRTNRKQKTNIIVFITPYVIRERADYLAILQKKIEERNLFMDLNYGTGQKKHIRESIKNHAKDLLEYKSAGLDAPYTPAVTGISSPPAPAPVVSTPPPSSQTNMAPEPAVEPAPEPAPPPPAEKVEKSDSNDDDFGPPSRRVRRKSRVR